MIMTDKGELTRLRMKPAQLDYLGHRTHRDLILKARHLGFSTAIQALLFHHVISRTAITVTLAHEDDTTQRFRRMADKFYENLPPAIKPPRKYANARLTSYPLWSSEAIIATAGNSNTGRGGTATMIHGSEVAFWPDAQGIMAGLMQGGDPDIVLESTPNGAQGYFYEKCLEALDDESDWTLHFYPWWFEPDYWTPLAPDTIMQYTDEEAALVAAYHLTPEQINWRRAKQRELKSLFGQEYPEDPHTCFLLSGMGYFGNIAGCFRAPLEALYQPDHRYVAGLDWGQTNDYTALSVFDQTARVQVDLLHIHHLEWKEMRRQIIEVAKRWHIRSIIAEANSMGSTNIEALRTELGTEGVNCSVIAFDTTNDSKQSIMASLHEAIHEQSERQLLLQPHPAAKQELSAFAAYQLPSGAWQLRAPNNMHDDTVIATALGNRAMVFGVSESDIAAVAENKLPVSRIRPDILALLKDSGVDLKTLVQS